MRQASFVILALIAFSSLLNKKTARRKLLFLLSFYMIFNLGWIFYHYTGILVADFPIFALIFLGHTSKGRFRYYFKEISTPAITLILWGLLTSLITIKVGWALAELSMMVRGYLVFVCVANHLKTFEDLKAILKGFAIAIILEFFIAVWQWRIGPTPFGGFFNEQFHDWRATGTFYMPHYLANYLLLLLPIVIRFFLYYKSPKRIMNIQYGVLFSLGLLTFLITFARGPWIGFAISFCLMVLFGLMKSKYKMRAKWALGLFVIGAGVIVVHYSGTIISQFGEQRSDATNIRFDQFRIARRVIKARPIFGTGLGNYELISPAFVTAEEHRDPRSWQFSEMVHNSYLFLTAQMGVPAFILFMWGVFLVFIRGYKVAKSSIPYFSNLVLGILTGFLGLGVAFTVGPDIKSAQLLMHIGMNVGIIIGVAGLEKRIRQQWIQLSRAEDIEGLTKLKKYIKSLAY